MSLEGVVAGGNIELGDVYFHPISLRAPLRKVFAPLLEDFTTVFGGRDEELAELVRFIQHPSGGYLVLTAPAGFGKTALAAALVGSKPEVFAYHFFAPAYVPESVSEDFFLRDVVEQMAEWHGRRGELPTELPELKALYHELLGEPIEQSRVLVVDGLDEVGSRWDVGSYVGRRLPPRSHVIVTVRDVGQDWIGEYGLPVDQTRQLSLAGLARDELGAVFHAAGPRAAALATNSELLDHTWRVTAYEENPALGADPFYARVLAEDVAAGRMTAADIGREPPGLANYLDRWWGTLRETAGEGPAGDMFGVLTVALGPLRREELEAICPNLKGGWAGDLFDEEILPRVRRFLVGDHDTGYALFHPRLRAYMRTRIRTLPAYRDKLVEFCADWQSNASRYALAHFAEHLAEHPDDEAERARLFALVDDRGWYDAKLADDPSAASFLEDVALAWRIAARHDAKAVGQLGKAPLLAREVRCALVTSSLRSLSRSVTSRLLAALVRCEIWTPAQAIALVRQNPHGGARARTLAALAPYLGDALLEEALTLARRIDDAPARGKALVGLVPHLPAARAHSVLEEAIEASRDRHSSIAEQVEVLVEVAALLPPGPAEATLDEAVGLAHTSDREQRPGMLAEIAAAAEGDRRDGLIDEAISLARLVQDPVERANIATMVAQLAPGCELDLVDSALDLARESSDPGPRIRTSLALLPVLDRDRGNTVLAEALDEADAPADAATRDRLLGEVVDALAASADGAIVRRAIPAARSIHELSARAAALASVAAAAETAEGAVLVAEALALTRRVEDASEQVWLLIRLLDRVPETQYATVLAETRVAARSIRQPAARAAAMVGLALGVEPELGDPVLREAFEFGGAMEAIRTVEADEVELAETVAVIAPHLGEQHRRRVVDETLAASRTIASRYDRARAIAALVPLVDADETLERAQEALDATWPIASDADRAEILASLVPHLPDPLRSKVAGEARAAAMAVDEGRLAATITVNDDFIIERVPSAPSSGLRARVLPALAPYLSEAEGERLLTEALDSIYEIPFQVIQREALTTLAPMLSPQAISNVLADLRSVADDGLRAYAISVLLVLTAEREGPDSALAEARKFFGDPLPADLLAAIAPGRESEEHPQAPRGAEPGEPVDDESVEDGGAEATHSTYSVSVYDTPDFINIYRLTPTPAAALGIVTIDPPPDDPAARAVVEEQTWKQFLARDAFHPEQAEVRDGLAAADEFRTGASWTYTRSALLGRLAESSADSAFAEAHAIWGDNVPVGVAARLAAYDPDPERWATVAPSVEEALLIEDDNAMSAVMATLLARLDGHELELALDAVESESRRVSADADSPQVVSRLARLLALLPAARRLEAWQESIRLASLDIRRDFLRQLPMLVALVEPLDDNGLWSETANALVEVRRRWP